MAIKGRMPALLASDLTKPAKETTFASSSDAPFRSCYVPPKSLAPLVLLESTSSTVTPAIQSLPMVVYPL